MSDPTSGGAGPIIIRRSILVDLWRNHGTKILGYAAIAVSTVPLMDRQLVLDTLGPNAISWCLLISGVLTAARGHTNTMAARSPQP
jgi:hypothetical protein